MITMRKSTHGFPFLSFLGMGLRLAAVRATGAPLSLSVRDGSWVITVMTSKCEEAVNNAFIQMDWKNIILMDIGKFRDVLVKINLTQPSVVDLVGSVNKRANETQFVDKRCQ